MDVLLHVFIRIMELLSTVGGVDGQPAWLKQVGVCTKTASQSAILILGEATNHH